MNVRILIAAAPLVLLPVGVAGAADESADARSMETADTAKVDAGAPDTTCVHVWPEARMRAYGYDHIVHVQNTCAKDASCSVATDVNPDAVVVKVAKSTEVETVTWLGSPAREFTPRVKCTLL